MKTLATIHEMSKELPAVQEFEAKMKETGAIGTSKLGSYIYEKDGYILVAAYRPIDGKFVGSIMTANVYQSLLNDAVWPRMNDMSLAYFAWTYGYGYDITNQRMDVTYIMSHLDKWHPMLDNAHKMGTPNNPVMYTVVEYLDTLPHEEYGVQEEYNIIGITDDIHQAEYIIERNMADKVDCNERSFAIHPIKINIPLSPSEKIYVGGACYIE